MNRHRIYDLAFYVPPDSPILDEYLAVLAHLGIRRIGTDGLSGWADRSVTDRVGETIRQRGMEVISTHSSIGLVGLSGDVGANLADNPASQWG